MTRADERLAQVMRAIDLNPGRDDPVPDRLLQALADADHVDEALLDPAGSLQLPKTQQLSQRELEVLAYASRGLSLQMIADVLCLHRETVRTYIKRARFKLRSKTLAQACCEALRKGHIS